MNPERHPALALRAPERRQLLETMLSRASRRAALGWRGWLRRPPAPIPGRTVVLAAGLLLTARTSLSRTLVVRVVGRGRREREVQAALDWLVDLGLFAEAPGRPSVLVPTPDALAILQAVEVAPLAPRHHVELAVPAHLTPLLEPPLRRDDHPPDGPFPLMALPRQEGPGQAAPQQPGRQGWPTWGLWGLAVVGVASGLVWWAQPRHPRAEVTPAWRFRLDRPPAGGGLMLGLDGAGMLLSLHQGALYRSVPDRLDFKRPMQFDGHDMPPECTLVAPSVLHAAMSPGRRFLWVELAGPRAPERCLVDMETRTVTHEAGQRLAPPGASVAVGWLSSSELALAEQAPPHPGAWHVVDVTTRRTVRVAPPGGTHVLRLDAVGGAIHRAALAWDDTAATWRVETQTWRDNQGFEAGTAFVLRGLVPPRGAVPGGAALAPDKRAMLASWAPRGGPSTLLTLTSLPSGDTVAVPLPGMLEADGPLFWGPEQGTSSRYRFYATLSTPRGPEPVAVEAEAAEASP